MTDDVASADPARPGDAWSMSGLERLRSGTATAGGGVPFEDVLPMPITALRIGEMACSLLAADVLAGFATAGLVGHLVALADRTLGGAVLAALGPGQGAMAMLLRIDLHDGAALAPPVACRGRTADRARSTALTTGELFGSDGAPIGHAVLRSFLFSGRPAPRDSPADATAGAVGTHTVTHCEAPLDVGWFDAFPAESVECGDRSASYRCTPGARLTNSLGSVHGGAAAILLDLAGALAVRTALGDEPTRLLDFTLRYLRPAPALSSLQAHAAVTQLSRSLVGVTHELRRPDGQPAVIAQSTRVRSGTETPA